MAIKTVTVYLGSSGHARPVFWQAAQQLGIAVAQTGRHLVYGGMDAGLMGALAKAALQAGGDVTGIIPKKLQDSTRMLHNLTKTIIVDDLWERKKKLFLAGDVLVALPGGFGTLDEMLEALYWASLGLHAKPIVLVNIEGYWDPIITYLRGLPDYNPQALHIVPDIESCMALINTLSASDAVASDLPHFEDEITRQTQSPIVIETASLKETYYVACALGLKQLARHTRPIGFYNPDRRFDALLAWFELAARETFITQKCLGLYSADTDRQTLMEKMAAQKPAIIDLNREKWGERKG